MGLLKEETNFKIISFVGLLMVKILCDCICGIYLMGHKKKTSVWLSLPFCAKLFEAILIGFQKNVVEHSFAFIDFDDIFLLRTFVQTKRALC